MARLVAHVERKRARAAPWLQQRPQLRVGEQELLGVHVVLRPTAEAVGVARDVVLAALEAELGQDGNLRLAATERVALLLLTRRPHQLRPRWSNRRSEAEVHLRFPLIGVVEGTAELLKAANKPASHVADTCCVRFFAARRPWRVGTLLYGAHAPTLMSRGRMRTTIG
eukprot:667807-Pleurochrysis_carterae.AAC.2